MRSFRASAIQLKAGPDKAANLGLAQELVENAVAGGSRLVALPEVFSWRGPQSDEAGAAEPIPGPTSDAVGNMARRLGIFLLAGSILEKTKKGGRCYNTSLLFGPNGALVARYRKIHLFSLAMSETDSVNEARTREPGNDTVCAATDIGNIAMAVCYDLRFPELFRRMVHQGAEMITIPSAFTRPTGEAHWKTLVRARAIENQCFVIAPNQYGETSYGFSDYGHSLLVDPWGEVLAEAGGDEDAVISAEFDSAILKDVRERLPSLRHRKPNL